MFKQHTGLYLYSLYIHYYNLSVIRVYKTNAMLSNNTINDFNVSSTLTSD